MSSVYQLKNKCQSKQANSDYGGSRGMESGSLDGGEYGEHSGVGFVEVYLRYLRRQISFSLNGYTRW